MNICPICGNPYISSKPTKTGGMKYFHQVGETFSEICTQTAASYKAAQLSAEQTDGNSAQTVLSISKKEEAHNEL